jgi:hypothetical protein
MKVNRRFGWTCHRDDLITGNIEGSFDFTSSGRNLLWRIPLSIDNVESWSKYLNQILYQFPGAGQPDFQGEAARKLLWWIWPFDRQRLDKHRLKPGITIEAKVHLLGNGSLVFAATDSRPKHELFGVVAAIRYSRNYKREFIREFSLVRDAFVIEFRRQFRSWVFSCGVFTSGQRKPKKWPTCKSEPSQSQQRRRHS